MINQTSCCSPNYKSVAAILHVHSAQFELFKGEVHQFYTSKCLFTVLLLQMWKESCIRTFCGCRGSCVKSSCLKWCHSIQCRLRPKTSLKMKEMIVWVWIFSIPYDLVPSGFSRSLPLSILRSNRMPWKLHRRSERSIGLCHHWRVSLWIQMQ